METLRIAIIADIHHGPDTPLKLGSQAMPLLLSVLDDVEDRSPDVFVDLGDRITDVDPTTDEIHLRQVAERLRKVSAPSYHLLGNHDLVQLSRETTARLLERPVTHASMDRKGWHLVFWQANSSFQGEQGLVIDEGDFEWLERDLAANTLPAIIFTHVPLDGARMDSNYYFGHDADQYSGYINAARARALLEEHSVVAAVSGHVHWNSVRTVAGIRYFTLQSLTECFTTYPFPAAAWGELELSGHIRFTVHGQDPFMAQFDSTRQNWLRRQDVTLNWAANLVPPK